MDPTKIEDTEYLYRAVRAESDEYTYVCGPLQISASAFNDRGHKPSVDRSALRELPEEARKSSTDKIVRLLTGSVRKIAEIKVSAEKTDLRVHAVDALHRPINDEPVNHAHSQIECDPEFENPSRFKKLKEALARLATRDGFFLEKAGPVSKT